MRPFPVCSGPICMKPWLWAMHPSAVPSVKSSSWGNAYPDYEALEEALEDELGYPDEDEIDW